MRGDGGGRSGRRERTALWGVRWAVSLAFATGAAVVAAQPAPDRTVSGQGSVLAATVVPPPAQPAAARAAAARATEREALLAELMAWAVRLTGLPPSADRPPVIALAPEALWATACPDDPRPCRGLVALYDTERERVLIRDSLDLADPSDQSFVVHEFVHHLQHRAQGAALVGRCEGVIAAEAQAYAAQNRFLAGQRQLLRVGDMLRRMRCPSADGDPVVMPFGTPPAPLVAEGTPPPAGR